MYNNSYSSRRNRKATPPPTSTFSYDYDYTSSETTNSSSSSSYSPFRLFSNPFSSLNVPNLSKRKKISLFLLPACILISIALLSNLSSSTNNIKLFESIKSKLGIGKFGGKGAAYLSFDEHKKAGIMALDKPYDRLRDVVWDLPVRESDRVVFWTTRNVGASYVVEILSECLKLTVANENGRKYQDEKTLQIHKSNGNKYMNVDTTTLKGIKRADKLNLISSELIDVMVTPHIREMADIFTEENQGRFFAFFRHPIEREYDKVKRGETPDDNWMTRFLIDKPNGTLSMKDLGIAKKVIREKVVVGLVDDFLMPSLDRISKYFGWKGSSVCMEEKAADMPHELLGDANAGTGEAWELLHPYNIYDVQLYEYARATFRAEEQTLIPLHKQIQFFGDNGEEEEEGEE